MSKSARENVQRKTSKPSPPPATSSWHGSLNSYPEKQRLVFADERELEKAVDLLWTDELRDVPHASPDGRSLIVPADATAYFAHAGIKFEASRMRSIADLSLAEIERIRQ